MPAKTIRKYRLISLLLLACIAAAAAAYISWGAASPQTTCAGCHEIESSSVSWAKSGHRDFHCRECHGTAMSNGLHSLKEKGMMVVHHYSGNASDSVRLTEAQVIEILDNCRRCHGTEYAQWTSGGHSATYASIFLDSTHNSTELLNADCLRCHGMFFSGAIEELVAPVSMKGPWRLNNPGRASWPAIPCLACHKIHREGVPAIPADYSDPKKIFYERKETIPPLLWYDRYEKRHVDAALLPVLIPSEGDRPVTVADDPRQRVCIQCHAPNAFHQAGTGDDRTPRGVHEGLSCLSCHEGHSNDPRRSCKDCHPAISNCGRDVTTMNTTFYDRHSTHNIHFVRCTDCHVKGIPPKRRPQSPGQ